jgi:hypothetical protein
MSAIDRYVASVLLCLAAPLAARETDRPAPRIAAVMEFELIDDMQDYERPETRDSQNRRIGLISDALRRELLQRGMYRIAANSAAANLISGLKAQQELSDCNGCEIDIGRALGADVIIIGWVQKVSNLILNINIEVREISSDRMLYVKSVDLRSNTDNSWLRGIRYMWTASRRRNSTFGNAKDLFTAKTQRTQRNPKTIDVGKTDRPRGKEKLLMHVITWTSKGHRNCI